MNADKDFVFNLRSAFIGGWDFFTASDGRGSAEGVLPSRDR
jgi:hypothetical protein